MNWHRRYRVGLSVVVIASPLSLLFYADFVDMPSGVQAPLFAIIAAMALAAGANARADQTWEKGLKWALPIIAIAAVGLSAFHWLLSEDAGTWIKLLGGVGTLLAVLALAVNIYEEANGDRDDEGG